MIKLIIGNKGSGKTKKLIDAVNTAVDSSDGNVVCVEQGPALQYNLTHRARLVDTMVYSIAGYESFYGLIAGLCAADYDLTDIFVDATLRIGGRDYGALEAFFKRIAKLAETANVNFVFTVSCDKAEIPTEVFEIAEEL